MSFATLAVISLVQRSGDGVGVGGLDRRQDDLGADRAPDVVEGPGELAVSIVNQEPDGRGIVFEGDEDVTGLLGDPRTGGVGVTPARCTRRL